MGKTSSSSRRKKRHRDSSRRKKRRGFKSKKVRRRADHSDDSESSSTESLSCSSSEDDYRRRKLRSKESRKRSRRRDSSSESEEDTRCLKKKKRSKRKDEYSGKKRTRLRKRRGRDVSVSSASSESCSAFRSESSSGSSGESEGARKRVRSERKGDDRGRVDRVKAKRRSRDESRSCSSRSQDVEPHDYQQVRDECTIEKSSRRLRSAIVVPTTPYDYEIKDKIGYDRDDYLTCGGNDSIDGADKGELEHHEVSQENEIMKDDEDGEAMISSPRTGAELGEDVELETGQATYPDNEFKGDDLETILRMRALENLRRFRGGTHRNGVARKETTSAAEGESLRIESAKVEDSPQKPGMTAGSKDFESSHKTLQEAECQKETGSVSSDLTYPQDQSGDTVKGKVSGGVSSCTTRLKVSRPPVQRQEIANLSSGEQAAQIQGAHVELTGEATLDKDCPESSQTLGAKKGSENVEPKGNGTPNEQQSSSCAETDVGGRELDRLHDETKEGFEEKTMSVMRGGEMVQVSYKVYIPKKTPALQRRKIKR